MQIAAQPPFNQSGLALHATAGKITFAGKMYVAASANASTESTDDFVIAQINMRAARGTDCRSGAATDLLFPFTFETLDDGAVLFFPKLLKSAEDGGAG